MSNSKIVAVLGIERHELVVWCEYKAYLIADIYEIDLPRFRLSAEAGASHSGSAPIPCFSAKSSDGEINKSIRLSD